MDSQTISKVVDEILLRGPGGSPLYASAVEYLQALTDGLASILQPLVEQYEQADAAQRLPGAGIQTHPEKKPQIFRRMLFAGEVYQIANLVCQLHHFARRSAQEMMMAEWETAAACFKMNSPEM